MCALTIGGLFRVAILWSSCVGAKPQDSVMCISLSVSLGNITPQKVHFQGCSMPGGLVFSPRD